MTSQLKVDKLQGRTTAGSIVVTSEGTSVETNLQQGLAKSWVNLDGTATDAGTDLDGVRDSFNVASVVDEATGQSTVSFSNNMSNDDFAITATNSFVGTGSFVCFDANDNANLPTTSTYQLTIINRNGSTEDENFVFGAIHGDLA
jgi:hypothetical protein